MTTQHTISAKGNQDNRFKGIAYKCLLPGKSEHKCDHWSCKATGKFPQYMPTWSQFFKDRNVTHFHVRKTKVGNFSSEDIARMPEEIRYDRAWLTAMKPGEVPIVNLNTGFIVDAVGFWPDREVYDFNEVAFIHVEYPSINSVEQDAPMIVSGEDKNKTIVYSANTKLDVKEVAIFVGVAEVKGGMEWLVS